MATRKTNTAADAAAAPAGPPEPTHGGVYEFVDGQLNVIEGGPPKPAEAAAPAQAAAEASPAAVDQQTPGAGA